jgi:tripartite-type tricarboxylate transporter receptor subunit TctC
VSAASLKLAILGVLGLALAATSAHAQDYPTQPVRIVVPYAAGGGVDAMARFLSKGLEQRLGQTFFIENRGGSATTLGAAHVARSAPDGYTILIGSSSTYAIAVSLYKRLAYDPTKDLTPISLIAAVPFVLVVHPSVPVNSVMELVALAKSRPGALNYASAGVGAPHHIYAELFKTMTGIDLRNVSYRGGGPALQDVVAGHVPITFADAGQALALIRDGKVKALGVTVAKRLETMPDVPTMHEAGVTGYEANAWIAIMGPANLPPAIVAKLNKALTEVVTSNETKTHFLNVGWVPLSSTPDELGAYIKSEIARWAKVVEAAGATGVE